MPVNEFARYSCQVALPGFGEAAQRRLEQSKILVVGIGGLGCPAAIYLASAGVGTLGLADHDIISISNLHRQVLYNEAETGQKKATVAKAKLQQQNPGILVTAYEQKVTADNIEQLIAGYDVVIDATDNFETHYLLNDACVIAGKPLVHGAIYQYEGHAAVWNIQNVDGTRSPNYRDIFLEVNALQIPDCTDGGVLPTIAGIIGCIQANEAIKIVTGTGEVLAGKMLVFDAQTMQSHVINIGAVTKTIITGLTSFKSIPLISKNELQAALNSDKFLLIDVRSAAEHAIQNIGGRNIPLTQLEHELKDIINGKHIVLYCASGKRSMQAVRWLQEKHPEVNASSLEGGINGWQF